MEAQIKGTTLPLLEMILQPGEFVISNHGELSWMTPNIQMSQTTSAGAGGGGGLKGMLKRAVGGGSLFVTRYEATAGAGMVTFAAKLPGRIFPIEITPGKGFHVHRHGWLCGTGGITPTIALQQSFRGGIYGGDGFILQRLEGEGQAWIELSGEITTYELQAGQSMLVHPGHVGLFEDTVTFQITRVPGIMNMAFGADGHHLVALTGPGNIWLQSMPISVLAAALSPYLGGDRGDHDVAAGAAGGVLGSVLGRNV